MAVIALNSGMRLPVSTFISRTVPSMGCRRPRVWCRRGASALPVGVPVYRSGLRWRAPCYMPRDTFWVAEV